MKPTQAKGGLSFTSEVCSITSIVNIDFGLTLLTISIQKTGTHLLFPFYRLLTLSTA